MEIQDLKAGIPTVDNRGKRSKTHFAADACRAFMEAEGWTQVFDLARGVPQRMLVTKTSRITGKTRTIEVKVTPDTDQRITAYKFITSYGYGRPAELAHADDSGRTVTDLLLAALRPQGDHGAGAQ